MKFIRLSLLSLFLLTPSCGVVKVFENLDKFAQVVEDNSGKVRDLADKTVKIAGDIQKVSGQVADGYKRISTTVSDKVGQVTQTIKAADKDGDGSLSWTEILALLGIGGGGTIVTGRNMASAAKKEKQQQKNDDKFDKQEERIRAVELAIAESRTPT